MDQGLQSTEKSIVELSSRKADCCNFEDGNMANYIVEEDCNQSYVFLQQQHFTPPPVDFQDGSQTPLMHKGSIIRNSQEYLKRNRLNNSSYELSQDLLDKQIELLERKYGGVRARRAAIVIQRAFRHYKMVKKFASITAMVKAEKRLSNRSSMQPFIRDYNNDQSNNKTAAQTMRVCAIIKPVSRSDSARERRNVVMHPQNSMNEPHHPQHAYVNLLHQQDQQYNNFQNTSNTSIQSADSILSTSMSNSLSLVNVPWTTSSSSPNTILPSNRQQYVMMPAVAAKAANANNANNMHKMSSKQKKVPPEPPPRRTSSIQSIQSPPPPPQKQQQQQQQIGQSQQVPQHYGYQQQPMHPAQVQQLLQNKYQQQMQQQANYQNQMKVKQQQIYQQDQIYQQQQQYFLEQKKLQQQQFLYQQQANEQHMKIAETLRKRQYRIGLNLFNKKPEKGIAFLIQNNFLENSPHAVAKFFISRKGLSRAMIGEYLGNLQKPFNMMVLQYFADEIDFSGMAVDVALRRFQSYFRMPGEAQKIERLMEVFSNRYSVCNPEVMEKLRSPDTVFVLAFAIIMLNTDLHSPNIKADRRMKLEDFVKNLRGIDDCTDVDKSILNGIYERVKESEFKTASDHVTQVMKVQKTINGKNMNLALPHRRLVCYCRLYEIADLNKKERQGLHQREVFLFNDLLVVTKILAKKKSLITYSLRNSFPLCGLVVTLVEVTNYPYCIRLSQKVDGKVIITFNARNQHDQLKFADDLRESIAEMDEMEAIRIEIELERQARCIGNGLNNNFENRDSGFVADMDPQYSPKSTTSQSVPINDPQYGQLKRGGALSNSMLDIHDQYANECRQRRGSVGSLDSGMSISFQTTLNVQKSSRVSDYSDPSLMLEESLNNLSRASNCSS